MRGTPHCALQTRLVFEAGQLKGSILMSFPDRIHALQKRTYENTGLASDKPFTDEAWAQVTCVILSFAPC